VNKLLPSTHFCSLKSLFIIFIYYLYNIVNKYNKYIYKYNKYNKYINIINIYKIFSNKDLYCNSLNYIGIRFYQILYEKDIFIKILFFQ